jgi:hypothetical protein
MPSGREHERVSEAWVGVVGVAVGVVITTAAQLVTMWRTNKRDDRLRFVATRQAAYADLLGLLDDIIGDDDGSQETLRATELNRAFGVVDLLAPQSVCDAATTAHSVAYRDMADEERVAVMRDLVNAMRADLGVTGGAWRQYLGDGRPAEDIAQDD